MDCSLRYKAICHYHFDLNRIAIFVEGRDNIEDVKDGGDIEEERRIREVSSYADPSPSLGSMHLKGRYENDRPAARTEDECRRVANANVQFPIADEAFWSEFVGGFKHFRVVHTGP